MGWCFKILIEHLERHPDSPPPSIVAALSPCGTPSYVGSPPPMLPDHHPCYPPIHVNPPIHVTSPPSMLPAPSPLLASFSICAPPPLLHTFIITADRTSSFLVSRTLPRPMNCLENLMIFRHQNMTSCSTCSFNIQDF